MNKEPVVWAAAITQIVESIIPVLILFGVLMWTDEQIAAVFLAVGVITKTVAGLFARSQVTPMDTYNEDMNSTGEPDIPPQ